MCFNFCGICYCGFFDELVNYKFNGDYVGNKIVKILFNIENCWYWKLKLMLICFVLFCWYLLILNLFDFCVKEKLSVIVNLLNYDYD